jgi:fluoride exporter
MAPTTGKEPSMPVYLAVAAGGALGSISRYGLDRLIERRTASVFPWSTFTINVTGCLVVGVVIAALVDRHHTPEWLRVGLVMGFVGGYTTFSTFGQETYELLRGGQAGIGLVYALGSLAVGVAAVALGTLVGRSF